MKVPLELFQDMLSVLAGILKIGNISFATAGGAQVSDKSSKRNLLSDLYFLFLL